MFCGNCGKEIKEGNKFCTNCGAKVTTQNLFNDCDDMNDVRTFRKECYKKDVNIQFGEYKNKIYYINQKLGLCESDINGENIKVLASLESASKYSYIQVNKIGIYLYITNDDGNELYIKHYDFGGKILHEYNINQDDEHIENERVSNVYIFEKYIYYVHQYNDLEKIERCDVNTGNILVLDMLTPKIHCLYAIKDKVIFECDWKESSDSTYSGWFAIDIKNNYVDCISCRDVELKHLLNDSQKYTGNNEIGSKEFYSIFRINLTDNIMWTFKKENETTYIVARNLWKNRENIIESESRWKLVDDHINPREYFDGKHYYIAKNYYTLYSADNTGKIYAINGDNNGHGNCQEFVVVGDYMYVDRAANYYLEQCELGIDKLGAVKKVWFD